jgi:hypothetical protein
VLLAKDPGFEGIVNLLKRVASVEGGRFLAFSDSRTGEMSLPALQPCRPLGGGVFVPAQSSRPAEDAVPHVTEVLRKWEQCSERSLGK